MPPRQREKIADVFRASCGEILPRLKMSGGRCSVRHMATETGYVTEGYAAPQGVAYRGAGGRYRGGHHHEYSDLIRFGAEALGTFMVVLAALSALIFTTLSGGNWLIVALTVGMMLAGAMVAVGHVTGGGEFNPAVTIGKAIAGRLAWRHVLPHIFGQILGAALAALVIWSIIPHNFAEAIGYADRGALLGSSAPGYGAYSQVSLMSGGMVEFGWGVAFLVEIIFTALFVAVVLGATRKRNRRTGNAPLLVGLAFAALWLMTWPITGAGLNPVRAFASVMLAGNMDLWRQLWLFVLGPLIGGALAGLFYRAFHPGNLLAATEGVVDPGGYTTTDVVDPVYVATAAPIVEAPVEEGYVSDSYDASVNEELITEPVEHFVVTEDTTDQWNNQEDDLRRNGSGEVVVEDGDPIVFGRDAQTAADILQADAES